MSDPRLGSPPPGGSRGLNKSTGSGVLLYAIGTGTVRNIRLRFIEDTPVWYSLWRLPARVCMFLDYLVLVPF